MYLARTKKNFVGIDFTPNMEYYIIGLVEIGRMSVM